MDSHDKIQTAFGPVTLAATAREIDPATGLWKLPAGYFFRVKRWNYARSMYSVQVQLRRRYWWGTAVLGHSLATADKENILAAAGYAMNDAELAIKKHLTIHNREQYLGDYPPKSIHQEETR